MTSMERNIDAIIATVNDISPPVAIARLSTVLDSGTDSAIRYKIISTTQARLIILVDKIANRSLCSLWKVSSCNLNFSIFFRKKACKGRYIVVIIANKNASVVK